MFKINNLLHKIIFGAIILLFFTPGVVLSTNDKQEDLPQPITAENATELVELSHLGRGRFYNDPVISPDGSMLVATTSMGLWFYDSLTFELIRFIDYPQPQGTLTAAKFSPDGESIAAGASDGSVWVWDVETGELQYSFDELSNWVSPLLYSPDGSKGAAFACREYDLDQTYLCLQGDFVVWDTETGDILQRFEEHKRRIFASSFLPDSIHIISYDGNDRVFMWDAETGEVQYSLYLGNPLRLQGISNDGSKMAVYNEETDNLSLFDTQTGRYSHRLEGDIDPAYSAFSALVFSPDDTYAAVIDRNDMIWVWDAETGDWLNTFDAAYFLTRIAFSTDGETLVEGYEGDIRIWNFHTGELVQTSELHNRRIFFVGYFPDGEHIISLTDDQTLWLSDVQTGDLISTLETHHNSLSEVAFSSEFTFSPDGRYIATGGSSRLVYIWDTETGEQLRTLEHTGGIQDILYSPGSDYLITAAGDNKMRIWDPRTGIMLYIVDEDEWRVVENLANSPNRPRTAYDGENNTIKVWDISTEEVVLVLEGHTDNVTSVDYSPNGDYIVSASEDETVRIWDIETGNILHTLNGHTGRVNVVIFSPDGTQIASGGNDGTIRVWDAQTSELLNTIDGQTDIVFNVDYPPGSSIIASAGYDNAVRLWDAQSGELLNLLKHPMNVMKIIFSPFGSRIATVGDDGIVRIWGIPGD